MGDPANPRTGDPATLALTVVLERALLRAA